MSLRAAEVFRPRRKRRKPELAVQKACLAYLRERGALMAVTDAGAAHRAGAYFGSAVPRGWPDITGVLPGGRFIGVECKAPNGRQSPAQKAMQREIRSRGGLYVLARSTDDLTKQLEAAGVQL
ncbi:MAG: VRR-NUC domain-containing protein [Phycisphaerae bacterium]